ncbi:MAG TPA: rhomboid family intramembrane serine protease [Planctomycetota bacterium]|nr:rhomboid family intramembrane serine protease [Planctomycetota bacterium]
MLFLPFDRRINDRVPWVVYTLVAINTAILIHSYFGFDETRILPIFREWGAIPTQLEPRTWISHLFLHAGPPHLVGNMAFLILFGMNVERRLGPAATLVLYFLSGFAALALFVVFNSGFKEPLVGASGAISGIVGMHLVLFRKRTVEVMWFAFFVGGIIRLPSYVIASFWIGLELLQAVFLNHMVMVAHWAHVGGFVGGLGLAALLTRFYRGHPEVYAADTKRRVRDNFEEKSYIPDGLPEPSQDGLRLVAREWLPLTGLVRRIVDSVAPGSGAFSTPSRLAGGLAAPQADDLKMRLERAGYPVEIKSQKGEAPAAPVVFLDRLEMDGAEVVLVDSRGAKFAVDRIHVVRIQSGTAGAATAILDLVTRDPWRRYRFSAATASMPLAEAAAAIRASFPGKEEPGTALGSLSELDEYFRWRLQLAV